jgi:hypothetical protein
MNPHRIEHLLRETDHQVTTRRADASDLAERVLRADRDRTRRKRFVSIASLALLVGATTATLTRILPSKPAVNGRVSAPVAIAPPLDPQLERIQSEIAVRESAVRAMLAIEKQRELNARLAVLRTLPTDDDVTERAASAIVFQADRMLRGGAPPAPAVRAFDEVISYFPKTVSADTARRRLSEINKEEG